MTESATTTPNAASAGLAGASPRPAAEPGNLPLYRLAFGGVRLTVLLLVLDALAFASSWLMAFELRYFLNPFFDNPINPFVYYTKALMVVVPLWLLVAASWGLYLHRERLSSLAQVRSLLGAAKDGLIASFAVAFLMREFSLGRSVVIMAAGFNFGWLWVSRTYLRWLRERALAHAVGLRRALVVGTGEVARRVIARLVRHPEIGYDIVGVVRLAANGAGGQGDLAVAEDEFTGTEPILGTTLELPDLIRSNRIEEVFIASNDLDNNAMLNLIARCDRLPASFKICSNMMEVITDRVKIDDMADLPVIPFRKAELTPIHAALKRTMDLAVAAGLFVVFAIPMAAIAAWIRLTAGSPILFSQERVGLHGKRFQILKFRTMTVETPQYAVAPTDPGDPRITAFGRFLRKTSLDELPQLFNVLRGDMSMVGPRPEMPFIVESYQEWQRRGLSVKPGITGLWQVIGRKNLPLAQHLEYDFYYIKNQSLSLDLLILVRTVPAVIFGRGAY